MHVYVCHLLLHSSVTFWTKTSRKGFAFFHSNIRPALPLVQYNIFGEVNGLMTACINWPPDL